MGGTSARYLCQCCSSSRCKSLQPGNGCCPTGTSKEQVLIESIVRVGGCKTPGQFVRIWAEEKTYGLPYVNATDLMSLTGIGNFSGNPRYLSKETDVDMEELIIHEGWLLIRAQGLSGVFSMFPSGLTDRCATHDLIRIIPKPGIPVGFLHAYLSSPVAQKQITGHTHGGQIDHVTHIRLAKCLSLYCQKTQWLNCMSAPCKPLRSVKRQSPCFPK